MRVDHGGPGAGSAGRGGEGRNDRPSAAGSAATHGGPGAVARRFTVGTGGGAGAGTVASRVRTTGLCWCRIDIPRWRAWGGDAGHGQ